MSGKYGHKFDSSGLFHPQTRRNVLDIELPVVFTGDVVFTGSSDAEDLTPLSLGKSVLVTGSLNNSAPALQIVSGSFQVAAGRTIITRVSGAGSSGFVFLGGIPAKPDPSSAVGLHNSSSVLLVLSGATGEGARNAIMFFATGSGAYNNNKVLQSGFSAGGGQIGVNTLGPTGSCYLFFNGRQLMAKTRFGEFVLNATGSGLATDGGGSM